MDMDYSIFTLTFSVNIAVAESTQASGQDTEKIFEHLDKLLKIFEG